MLVLIGLMVGNFACIPLFDIPIMEAVERSFFQAVAVGTYVVLKG